MIKVGRDKIQVGEKVRKFSYRDIPFDPDGWADAKKYLPADYDLMFLNIKDKKSSCGWSVGNKWDGSKLENTDEILYWKKKPDEVVKCKAVLQ